jgi:mercuric ion binding protein
MKMLKTVLVLLTALPTFAQAKPVTVQVKGMVCAFCAQGIEKKFKAMPEISSVKVSLETKLVDLEIKEGKDIPDDKITTVITEAGYDVVKIERKK